MLSFAQERLWFLDRLDPGSAIYNVPLVFEIDGRLNCSALERSFQDLVARHTVLNRAFAAASKPGPRANECDPAPFTSLSASGDHHKRLHAFVRQPFDLARDPPIRALLLSRAPDKYTLALVAHHFAVDGVTLEILQRELLELYAARIEEREPQLPPLEAQYADFAQWQREWLSGGRFESRLSYWRSRLAGVDDSCPLHPDRPRPARRRNLGAVEVLEIPSKLQDSVRQAAEQAGGSPYMVFLSAFFVLLFRYSGREDLCVGTLLANRSRLPRQWRRAVRDMVGFFANTLALRQPIRPEWSFHDVLQAVQATALGAFAHQDMPFEKLVEALDPPRDLSKNPLFQITFALQEVTPRAFEAGGLRIHRRDVHTGASRSDLMLTIDVSGAQARAIAEYDSDLFDASTIRRLLRHYLRLAGSLLADPFVPVSRATYLELEELRRLTTGQNTLTLPDPSACIHVLFEEQARLRPDAIGIRCGTAVCSYGELNANANRVAHRLLALGVQPEDRIGILARRSMDCVAAMLGVLKAGAAYTPIDPLYPPPRIAHIVADAAVKLILAGDAIEDQPPGTVQVIPLAEDVSATTNPNLSVDPANLAYILYTSGSTGEPKGVAIEHRNVTALIAWARRTFAPTDLAHVLCATSFSFDVSVFELFAPLLCGGSVELVDNLLALSDSKTILQPTLISGVPSAFDRLLRSSSIPPSARVAVIAGERLTRDLADRIYAAHPKIRVYDCYGPTEDTVYATCALRTPGGLETIGTSLPHGRAYVLDPNLQPLPAGAPGELYLAGRRLARGYWNQPQLTSKSFLPDPFAPGERMYRTGDRARRLADGALEYLGRADRQLKVRGFRIEPGEIETKLLAMAAVREACALVCSAPDDPTLTAYVVCDGDCSPASLRASLNQQLPRHAVPSRFVILPSLPRLPNGKIDYVALPSPFEQGGPPQREPPKGESEEMVAAAFARALRLEHVGRHDNFFELGGHSLLALDLFLEIERLGGPALPLAALFQYPTPFAFAAFLDRSRPQSEPVRPTRPLVTIRSGGSKPPIFAVPGIGGNVIGLAPLARALGEEQPFYGFQSRGLDGKEKPWATIAQIASDYLAELRTVTAGSCILLGVCWGTAVAVEMAQRLSESGSPPTLLALLDPPLIGGIEGPRASRGLDVKRIARAVLGLPQRQTLEECQRRVIDSNREAARTYRPSRYAGNMAIFLSDGIELAGGPDTRLAWVSSAEPSSRTFRVPGETSDQALAEPNVKRFARLLADLM